MKRQSGRAWGPWLRRSLSGAVAILGSAWLAGCYQYIPIDPSAVAPGTRVRAELTTPGAERLAAVLARDGAEYLQGKVVSHESDGILLLEVAGQTGAAPVGVVARPLMNRVALNPGELMGLELKKLDKTRTGLFIGGSALLAAIVVAVAFDVTGGGDGEGQGPGVDEARIPLITIRW